MKITNQKFFKIGYYMLIIALILGGPAIFFGDSSSTYNTVLDLRNFIFLLGSLFIVISAGKDKK